MSKEKKLQNGTFVASGPRRDANALFGRMSPFLEIAEEFGERSLHSGRRFLGAERDCDEAQHPLHPRFVRVEIDLCSLYGAVPQQG